MKKVMTVNATVWFVVNIKNRQIADIQARAQESYNAKARFYDAI